MINVTRIANLIHKLSYFLVLKKLTLTEQQVLAAITNLDFRTLGTEFIDLLTNILPNEQEVKAFKNYESDGKPLAALSPTDQFLIQVSLM